MSTESSSQMATIPRAPKDIPDSVPGVTVDAADRKRGRKKKIDKEDCPQSAPAKIRRSSRIFERRTSAKQDETTDSTDLVNLKEDIGPELQLALERCLEKYFKRFEDTRIVNSLISKQPELALLFEDSRAKCHEQAELLKHLMKELKTEKHKMTSEGEKIEDIRSKLEIEEKTNQSLEKCNRTLTQSIADRDVELKAQIEQNKLLSDEVSEKDKTIREKDLLLESLKKALDEREIESREQKEKAEIEAKEQREKLEALNLIVESKEKLIEKVNEKLVERESRILSLECEKAILDKEIAEHGLAQSEAMSSKLESLKILLDEKNEKLNDGIKVIENLNQKLSKKDSEVEDLTSNLQSQKDLFEEQREKLVDKEKQIEDLTANLIKKDEEAEVNSSKLESLKKLLDEQEEKLSEGKKVIENLTSKLRKKDGEVEDLRQTHQDAIADHLSEVQALNLKIETMKEVFESGSKMFEKKSDEAAESKVRYEQASAEIVDLKSRLNTARTEIADLKTRLNTAVTMFSTLTAEKMRREEGLKLQCKNAIDRFRNAVNNSIEEEDVRNRTTVGKIAALKKAVRKSLAMDVNFDDVN